MLLEMRSMTPRYDLDVLRLTLQINHQKRGKRDINTIALI